MSILTPAGDAMDQLLVTAEVLSSLNLCHVTVRWPDYLEEDASDALKIRCERGILIVTLGDGSQLRVNSVKGVEFADGEQRYTVSGGRYINVRLALTTKSSVVRSICSDLATDIRSLMIKGPYDCLRRRQLLIVCASCNAVVSNCVEFDRIREMPAANWDQSSEEWFCHGHGSAFDKLKPGTVTPKLRDCFFSDLFFQVKDEVLLESRYQTDCHANYLCCECNDVFGVKEKEHVKLWSHRVKWVANTDQREVLYSNDELGLLVTLIDNLSVDSFGVNSRIVLTKQSSNLVFLYMSVMDVNLTFLTSTDSLRTTKNDTNTQEKNEYASGKRSQSSACHKRSQKGMFEEGRCEVSLHKKSVVKVLYKLVLSETDETMSWADNVNVNVYACPESLFDTVYSWLVDSTQGLEAMADEKLSVGYIFRK